MRGAMTFVGVAVLAAGVSTSPGRPPRHFESVAHKCVTTASGVTVVLGGVEIGTVTSASFPANAGCTVIPPTSVANSVALRCYVDGANTAHIVASTAIALGVSLSAATWCVEVRKVAAQYME